MNQIGVDSEFKGQCSRCKKAILGQVVTALGKVCFILFQFLFIILFFFKK